MLQSKPPAAILSETELPPLVTEILIANMDLATLEKITYETRISSLV